MNSAQATHLLLGARYNNLTSSDTRTAQPASEARLFLQSPDRGSLSHSVIQALKQSLVNMVYDCSPTQLALALIPTFAGLLYMHLASTGTEMLPGEVLRDLETRIQGLAIMTKDQLMCLAAELLPPEGVRTLMQHLSVMQGFSEWDEIRRRRRRALVELSLTYLAVARLQSGAFAAQGQHLHTYDLAALERETYIGSYTARLLVEPLRTQYLESTETVRGRFFEQCGKCKVPVYRPSQKTEQAEGGDSPLEKTQEEYLPTNNERGASPPGGDSPRLSIPRKLLEN